MTRPSPRTAITLELPSFLRPAAFSALFVLVGAGIACSSSDGGSAGSAGQSPGSAGAAAGAANPGTGGASPAGGGTVGGGGAVAMGGAIGSAGSAPIGGTASVAGSSGSSAGNAGSSNSAGASGSVGTAGNGAGGSGGSGGAGVMHWVGTWTASPYATASDGMPPSSLANAVARQVTHASLGGSQIRVQFSNKEGKEPLVIKAAHVALCKAAPLVDGSIDTTTDKALAFSGMPGVTIPAGMELWSDPIAFELPALGNVSITTAFGSVPSALTSHNGARTDSYVQANSSDVSVANLTSAPKNQHWYFISGMDVMAPAEAKAIVAIGDSITDGRGVTPNANNRWTDVLAARLQANTATKNVSLVNQGIGATKLAGSESTTAESRFARDVLGQSGVKYVIILDGVNDIGENASFATLKAAYDKLIKAGRDKGLLVYGGTITPFGGNSYDDTPNHNHEAVRVQANTYIKSGVFDGYIDFDAAVSDKANPANLLPAANSTDKLHPGPEGYKLMAEKADLTLFTK